MRLVIWLVAHGVQLIHVDSEQIAQTHGTMSVINDKSTWWGSQRRCRDEFQADLFQSGHIPLDTADNLNLSTYYWIGAMAYGTWNWTPDKTALYQYAGYRKLPTVPTTYGTFVDNSVFRCNRHCKEDYSVFGLSGKTCYCFKTVPEDEWKTRGAEVPCAGNLDERCGTVDGMSVYHLGETQFIPKPTGKCAYVYKNYAGDIYMTTTSCSEDNKFLCSFTSRSFNSTCQNNVSPSNTSLPWSTANGYCNLLTLATRTCVNLAQLLPQPLNYWIGRDVVSDAHIGETEFPSSLSTCLAVIKDGSSNTMRYEWLSCEKPHGFICSIGPTENIGITDIRAIGMYIGIGIGCTLLVTAICVPILMKRQKMLCFKSKEGHQQVQFHTGRTTNGVDIDSRPENSEYSVIDQHEHRLTKPESPDVYNFLSGATQQKSKMTCINPYSHLSGPGKHTKYTGDYDTTESLQRGGDSSSGATGRYSDTSSCVDQQGERCHLLDEQETGENHYNVLGKQVSSRDGSSHVGIYDRIGTENGLYDLTLHVKTVLRTDSYSHVSRPYMYLEDGQCEAVDTKGNKNAQGDTYNHTA
ncbi:uncharacterized protein [Haliotis asinina]|uniref:uncharacterized protein n=1 Tax=Haliotis asinina TaxID=109174 RepID=UPI00353271FA